MSKYGGYMRTAQGLMSALSGEKPHSSITDWIEVLSSDRYDEASLDGIPELVDSINLQGQQGTTEAARAIRKKLKYGNTHRQIRALVILRALTDNAGHGFKLNWANQQIMERLRDMATDVSFRARCGAVACRPRAGRATGEEEACWPGEGCAPCVCLSDTPTLIPQLGVSERHPITVFAMARTICSH
jgi:hypothetical protein